LRRAPQEGKECQFHAHIWFSPLLGHKNEGPKQVKSIKCRSSSTHTNVKRPQEQAKFFARGTTRRAIKHNLISTRLFLVRTLPEIKSSQWLVVTMLQAMSWQFFKTSDTCTDLEQEAEPVRARTATALKIRLDESKSWLAMAG
jgi:hypothetical protein